MKQASIITCLFVSGIILNTSCKKEYSCENCNQQNQPPIADAGPDQIIFLPTDSIMLDGSSSSDADGVISSSTWRKITGPASILISAPSLVKTVVKKLTAGLYIVELKVTDNGGLIATDTMQIIVNNSQQSNHPPVAIAGADQQITLPVDFTNLDGSASQDPENNISTYRWTKISGPSSYNIENADSSTILVISMIEGIYHFAFKVTDAGGLFSTDTIVVIVIPESILPQSNCDPGTRLLVPAQLIPIGTLSQTRTNVTISAAGNKILFAGGATPVGYCATSRVDIYDIYADTWTVAELSESRYGMGVAALGNKIFFGGGFAPKNLTSSATCYIGNLWYPETRSSAIDIYDVSVNTWSTAKLSAPRTPRGASAGNKVIFAGGDAFSSSAFPSDVTDIYDATSNVWTSGSLSESKGLTQIATASNKIYLAGGAAIIDGDNSCCFSKRIDTYDAYSGSWSVDYLSKERTEMGSITANDKIYWAGGYFFSGERDNYGERPTSSVEILDLATNTTTFDCLSEPKAGLTAVRKDNKLIFLGGLNGKFDIYDLTTNSWSIGVLPQNLCWASIISYNNTIYVAGGSINNVVNNQVWKLEF